MGDTNQRLLSLLKDNLTVEDIKQQMNLTSSQLLYRLNSLKYQGYMIHQKYYGNGDITVSLLNFLPSKYTEIYTKRGEHSLRSLAISDLHYFHKDENRRAIDTAFEYCLKNGIHIIFVCGDLIDCLGPNQMPMEEQAERFTELYPYDKSIISFCVLGNHDIKVLQNTGLCFKKLIESKRFDVVPIRYGDAGVRIKNGSLFLSHPINDLSANYSDKGDNLKYIGHSHTTKISGRNVYVPSLSNVSVGNQKNFKFVPQALDATLTFNSKNGSFSQLTIDQLIMEDDPYVISEHKINLNVSNPPNYDLEVDEYPSLVKKR